MNYRISPKQSPQYENFIASCPDCDYENVYNRISDLGTLEFIDYKLVNCYHCNELFVINNDTVSEPYQSILLDAYELKKQKRYMHCILSLAQALESFLGYCIKVKIVCEPYQKNILESLEDFNLTWVSLSKEFAKHSFCKLSNTFFNIYLKDYSFSNKSEINKFICSYQEYSKNKPKDEEIKNYHDSTLGDLFLRLKKTAAPEKRNQVVHKRLYRPTLNEVEECLEETRDIVFKLKYHLKIRNHIEYINNRNVSY